MPSKIINQRFFVREKFTNFSRKSQGEDLLLFFLAIIIIVSIALYFSFKGISQTSSIKERLDYTILVQDSSQSLVSYLRNPFTYKNLININMADALSFYFITNDEDLLKQVKIITTDFFSKSDLETDYSSWSMEIEYPGKKTLIIESEKSRTQYILRKEFSTINLPTNYYDKFIEIKLFFVQTRYVVE